MFGFQPFTIAAERELTLLDCLLEGCQLLLVVVLDTELFRDDPLACPPCGAKNSSKGEAGEPTKNKNIGSWPGNAHSCKGKEPFHTIYIASKKRLCTEWVLLEWV